MRYSNNKGVGTVQIATNGSITNGALTFPVIAGVIVPDNIDYLIYTGVSLSGSANITLNTDPLMTPYLGMECRFIYFGKIATFTNSSTVTILGKTLTSAQAGMWLNVVANYVLSNPSDNTTGGWVVSVTPFNTVSNITPGINELPIVLSGQTKTLIVGTDNTEQSLVWSGTLTGSNSVTGTALNGIGQFILYYNGSVTIGAYAITLFGITLTAAQAKQQLTINAVWDNTASEWVTTITGGLNSQPVSNPGINKVTLTGASQVSQTLTPGVSKDVLELAGNTTLTGNYSVTLANPSSGEASFTVVVKATLALSTYTLTIGGNVINAAMALAGGYTVFCWWDSTNTVWITQVTWYNPYTNQYSTKVTIPTASVLTGYTAPVLVIPAPPSSQAIKILPSSSWSMVYNSTTYAAHLEQALSCGDTATPPNLATIAQYIDSACLGTSSGTRMGFFTQEGLSGATSTQIIAGQGIYWWVEAGNPTTGNSDCILYLDYEIVTL